MNRYFIFEGADGIGKTTLAKNFAAKIGARFTYEPFGHTEETKRLRERALTHDIPQLAREYLLLANRDLGYQDLKKWLQEGDVVTDRSIISGMVYALSESVPVGAWAGMAKPLLDKLLTEIVPIPTVILCTNDAYKNKDNPEDRYDGRGADFHDKISKSFEWVAEEMKFKYVRFKIDFNISPEENLKRLVGEL